MLLASCKDLAITSTPNVWRSGDSKHAAGQGGYMHLNRASWWRQAMLYACRGAADIKPMLACGALILAGKATCELRPVVRQNILYPHWGSLYQSAQEVGAAGISLVAVNTEIYPPRCTVNDDKLITSLRLIGHLWLVLDDNIQEPWLRVFESYEWCRFLLDLQLQAVQIEYPMTGQLMTNGVSNKLKLYQLACFAVIAQTFGQQISRSHPEWQQLQLYKSLLR